MSVTKAESSIIADSSTELLHLFNQKSISPQQVNELMNFRDIDKQSMNIVLIITFCVARVLSHQRACSLSVKDAQGIIRKGQNLKGREKFRLSVGRKEWCLLQVQEFFI